MKNVSFNFDWEKFPVGEGIFIKEICFDYDGFLTIEIIRSDGITEKKSFITYHLEEAIKTWLESLPPITWLESSSLIEASPIHHVSEYSQLNIAAIVEVVTGLKALKNISLWETNGRNPEKVLLENYEIKRTSEISSFGEYADTANLIFNEKIREKTDPEHLRHLIEETLRKNNSVKVLLSVAKLLGIKTQYGTEVFSGSATVTEPELCPQCAYPSNDCLCIEFDDDEFPNEETLLGHYPGDA